MCSWGKMSYMYASSYVFPIYFSHSFIKTNYRDQTFVFHALTFARSRGRCWKPRPETAVFNTSLGAWPMLMHWKTMFDRYYCIKLKTFATFCVISCTILFRLFTDVSRMQFPRTMLVLGPGSTHLVTAAILWPPYEHIESYMAVH